MSGSNNRKRQEILRFRVTAEEKEQIEQDAGRAGVSTGYYARHVLLDAPIPRQAKRPSIETDLLKKTLAELNKIGSNINQLARSHNQRKPPYREDVLVALESLNLAVLDVLKALGKAPANDH